MKKSIPKIKNQISLPVINVAPPCVDTEASYTVEAVVVIPFFVGLMLVILFFFQVLITQQVLGKALLETAGELAVLSYEEELSEIESASTASFLLKRKTNLPVFLETNITEEYIDLRTSCNISLPIGLFDIRHITINQRAKCRTWRGKNKETSVKEEIVYITPAGSAYHKSRECPYLQLTLRAVSGDKIHTYRNKSGEKYYRCKRCTKENSIYSHVVITDYGNYYHSKYSCKGLKRNVLAVWLSKVEGRHSCMKCEGE